jgi:hypothetical protein
MNIRPRAEETEQPNNCQSPLTQARSARAYFLPWGCSCPRLTRAALDSQGTPELCSLRPCPSCLCRRPMPPAGVVGQHDADRPLRPDAEEGRGAPLAPGARLRPRHAPARSARWRDPALAAPVRRKLARRSVCPRAANQRLRPAAGEPVAGLQAASRAASACAGRAGPGGCGEG